MTARIPYGTDFRNGWNKALLRAIELAETPGEPT